MNDKLLICYHGISERWPSRLAVRPGRLEEQLWLLTKRGYQARTFLDTVAASDPGRYLAVTFDDGYRSVFELAFPVLRAAGMPGTVFVPSALMGMEEPMAWPGVDQWLHTPHAGELAGMSWDQLGELADAGWEIGSHTRLHARLPELGDDALAEELSVSRQECEMRLGRPCLTIAYPYGSADGRVVAAAEAAGYVAGACPMLRLPEPSRLHWPRVMIYRKDDRRRFRAKLSPAVRRLYVSPAWRPIMRVAGGRLGNERTHVS